MNSRSYAFLDVAVLEAVGARFAAGDALVILSERLDEVLWANGPGARLFGFSDIFAFIGADPELPLPLRRQIASIRGYPHVGHDRPLMLRLASGMSSRAVGFSASSITMPDGENALLLAAAEAPEARSGEQVAAHAIEGLSGDGQFVALVDERGGPAAASAGFAELGISGETLRELADEVASESDRLVKRLVAAARGSLPAGMARLTETLNLLMVIDEAVVADDSPDQTVGTSEAGADQAKEPPVAETPAEAPAQPPVQDAVPAAPTAPPAGSADGTDADEWYFNGQPHGASENREASLQSGSGAKMPPPAARPELSGAPVRFVWRTDAEGRFSALSDEFRDAFGPEAADVIGRRFTDVARVFGLDPNGDIAGLLERRDTWSGRSVLWPVAGTDLKVPVDLAALPVYGRERDFEGFRGFGVARMGDAVADPEAIGLALRSPPPAAPARPAANEAGEAPATEPPGHAEEPVPGSTEAEADTASAEDAAVEDPFRGEVPALLVTGNPERRTSDKIIQLAERRPNGSRGLSAAERLNFDQIGEKLRTAGLVVEPIEEAEAQGSPAAEVSGETGPAEAPQALANGNDEIEPAGRDEAEELLPAEAGEEAEPAADEEAPAASDEVAAEATAEAEADEADIAEAEEIAETVEIAETDEIVAAEAESTVEPANAEEPAPQAAVGDELAAADDAEAAAEDAEAVSENADAMGDEPQAREAETAEQGDEAPEPEAEPALEGEAGSEPVAEAEPPAEPPVEEAPEQPETPEAAAKDKSPASDVFLPSAFAGLAANKNLPGIDAAVLSRLPLPVLIHAGDALFYANIEFLQITGYHSLAELERAGGLGAIFGDPYASDETADRSLRLRTRDGDEFPVDAFLQSVAWNGGKALLLALKRREAAEVVPLTQPVAPSPAPKAGDDSPEARLEELRTIIDTATDGVVIISNDGKIRSISRPAEALFGFNGFEVVGQDFASLFAIESQKAAADYLAGLAENGVASVLNDGREVIGREAQGRFIPLFMTIGRLPNGSGFCAVVRDITQWKRAEEELTNARAEAERASAQKTEFLARVSHEIRTPLNAIIGFSELMIDEKFGPISNDRYKDYLRDINKSGNHVLDLVNDLLDISKIEAGQQEMSYEAVSLSEVLGEAVAMMQPQANRERVIIRSSFTSRLPEVVADLRSIRQIALNLLSNAIRYTPAGGQVIVSTAYEQSGDIVMRVRDTGIGMAAAEIEQALKPFKQINALKRPRGDGTGLGLPLTKAMVEANRARFAIHSTPGEGTLVEVTFPSTRVLAH